ncbi:MAG TPA: DUF488 family protein [Rhodothermales bacterium]
MSIRIVRLGTARAKGEGLRIGTVRRPPRGVKKEDYSKENYYDVWFPNLAPSQETVKMALGSKSDKDWAKFVRAYRKEMSTPEAKHALGLLAALSHTTNFSVGCYCEDESRCHRSILRELLKENGADVKN